MAETLGMPPKARRQSFAKIEQMQGSESNAAALVSLQVGETEEKARFADSLEVESTPATTKANLTRQVRRPLLSCSVELDLCVCLVALTSCPLLAGELNQGDGEVGCGLCR